jgi:hypothetical protein
MRTRRQGRRVILTIVPVKNRNFYREADEPPRGKPRGIKPDFRKSFYFKPLF